MNDVLHTNRGEYITLTEDNLESTIIDLLRIYDESELKLLETLPLTEACFEEAINHYPYIEETEANYFEVQFWGFDEEGKLNCLFEKYTDPTGGLHIGYYLTFEIENDQIASFKIEYVGTYGELE